MRPIFLFCFVIIASSGYTQQKGPFEDQLEALLQLYVADGLIDYNALKDDPRLSHTYQSLADAPDTVWSNPMPAFLVNAYNLAVIREICRSYPISTVREIPGFFDRKRHLIAGKSITLDQLEQHILNITGRDPAIHFVLVCGAVGCPPLISEVYRHNNWPSLKEKQTHTALNDPVELAALESALGDGQRPLLYSHKAALGHSLGAAGLLATAINCLAHRHGMAPPNPLTTHPLPMHRLILPCKTTRRTIGRSLVLASGFGGSAAAVQLVSDWSQR